MNSVSFDEESALGKTLRAMGPFGVLVVDAEKVNLNDFLQPREGMIIRVRGNVNDCIKFIAPEQCETLGCVAGWISEE